MSKKSHTATQDRWSKPTWLNVADLQRLKANPTTTRKSPHAAGFTLLEILIAIFIFATIVTTLFASFRTVFSDTDIVNKDQVYYEMAKGCLNRMIIDLQSIHVAQPPAYIVPDFNNPPEPYRIVSNTDNIRGFDFPRLRFTSMAHLPFGKNQQEGIAEIVYYVQDTAENKFVLKRSDILVPLETFKAQASDPTLCEDLKKLEYKFYDQNGIEYETWDSEMKAFGYATPRAINIKLELDTGSNTGVMFETRVTLPVGRDKKE